MKWNPSNPDSNGREQSDYISEVSLFLISGINLHARSVLGKERHSRFVL